MRYSRRKKDPDDISQYRRRPDDIHERPRTSADQAMDWLSSPDDGGAPGHPSDVGGRYGRDAYAGCRSRSGAERAHVSLRGAAGSAVLTADRPAAPVGVIVRRVLLALLALLAVLAVIAGIWLHSLNAAMQLHDPALSKALTGIATPFKPYYVLIVGSDARGDEASRTDTIILARIDPTDHQVTLVSIPRDTYVDIDGYGPSKINAAYAYGGAALTVKTVSEFAGVDIAHFVEVGFDGFEDIVDAVGGVTVDVPADTTVDDITLPEGTQTLDGVQALVFVRCRKTYALGDYQRAANQRQFLAALATSVKKASFWRWPGIAKGIASCVSTDWSAEGMALMALEVRGMDASGMYTAVVPSYTEDIDGVSYVVAYDDDWTAMMSRVDQGLDPNG